MADGHRSESSSFSSLTSGWFQLFQIINVSRLHWITDWTHALLARCWSHSQLYADPCHSCMVIPVTAWTICGSFCLSIYPFTTELQAPRSHRVGATCSWFQRLHQVETRFIDIYLMGLRWSDSFVSQDRIVCRISLAGTSHSTAGRQSKLPIIE